jgi:hypothetical protein
MENGEDHLTYLEIDVFLVEGQRWDPSEKGYPRAGPIVYITTLISMPWYFIYTNIHTYLRPYALPNSIYYTIEGHRCYTKIP